MLKHLTQKQIDSFNSDGFLSPLRIFTEVEALEIRGQLEEAERKWPEAFVGVARNNAHLNFTFLDKIVHNERLVDAIEDLLGSNILAYATVLFIKEPEDPSFVTWHQDGKYMGLSKQVGVTAWVALSEANEESGCMSMIPGSHNKMLHHNDTFGEHNILTRGQEIEGINSEFAITTPLRPGQCSFHSPTLVHGSAPNRSKDRRIGFAIQTYMPTNIKQTLGRTAAQLVRGVDAYGNFDLVGRPKFNMEPAQVSLRDRINNRWSAILYTGADKKRDF